MAESDEERDVERLASELEQLEAEFSRLWSRLASLAEDDHARGG